MQGQTLLRRHWRIPCLEALPAATWKRFQLSAFSNFVPYTARWVLWDVCWSLEMPWITPKGVSLPEWPGSGSCYSPLSVGNTQYHQCLASCVQLTKLQRLQKQPTPHTWPRRDRLRASCPWLKREAPRKPCGIYIYIYFLTRAKVIWHVCPLSCFLSHSCMRNYLALSWSNFSNKPQTCRSLKC